MRSSSGIGRIEFGRSGIKGHGETRIGQTVSPVSKEGRTGGGAGCSAVVVVSPVSQDAATFTFPVLYCSDVPL